MRGNISTDLEHRKLIRIDSLVSEVRSNLYRFCKEFKVNIIFEHNMQLIEKKYLKSLYIYSIKINNKLSSAREVLKNLYGNIIEGYDDIVLENILSVYEEKLNLNFQKEVLNGNLKDDYFNLYKNIYYKNSVDFQISFQIIDTETILSLYKLEKSKFNEVCRECELNRINVFNEETNIFYLRKEVEFFLDELKYADFYNECSRRFYDGKWVSGNRALELLMLGNETRKRNKEFCQYLKKSEVAINRRKLERKAYDIYYDDYSEEVYSMMDISAFWNEHLFSGIFAKKIKITNNEFVNLCDELLIEKVYLCNDEKFYIRKEDFEESIKENFISKKEVIDKYCAGKEVNLYKINNRYNDRHDTLIYYKKNIESKVNEINKKYNELKSHKEWITIDEIRMLFRIAFGDFEKNINFLSCDWIKLEGEIKIREVEYTNSIGFEITFYNRRDIECIIERMKPINIINDEKKVSIKRIEEVEKRYEIKKLMLGKGKESTLYDVQQVMNAIKEIDQQYYKLMSNDEWITENDIKELFKVAYGDIGDDINFTDEVKIVFKNEMKIQEVEYTQSEEFKAIFYNRNDIENFIERMKPISLIEDGSDQIKRLISIIEKRYDLEKVKLGKGKYNIFYNVKQIKNAIKEIDHQYYKLMSDSEWITENDMRELFRIAYGDIADGMNFAGKCGVVLEENITIQKVENTQSEKLNTIFYNKSDAEKFVNSLISREQLFMAICKSNRRLIEFEKKHALKVFKLGKFNSLQFYSEKEFDSKFEEYDRGKYCSIEEFAKEYFDKGDKYLKSFIPNLKKSLFKVKHLISMKKLEKPYVDLKNNIIVEEVYLRSEIELFFEKYIKVTEAYNLFNKEVNEEIHKVTFTTYKNRLNIECVILGNNTDEYMLKSDFQRIINEYSLKTKSYLEYIQNNNYYVQTEVRKKLNISEKHLYKLLEEEVLEIKEVYNTINLYDKGEIDYLKKYQDEQISYFKNKYMSNSELVLKYNERFARYITTYNRNHKEKIKELNIPRIIRGFYKANDMHLYNKNVVQEIYEKYEVDNKLKSIMYEDKFEEFKYKVEEVVKVEFKSLQQKTKRLWYEFVEKRLIEIKKGENITTIVNQYVRNTNYIFSIFKKEIFMYKEIEINDLYMNENSNIEKTYQKQFLTFLRVINNTFMHEKKEILFNIKEINDPYSYKKMRKHDESIYTYSEYEQLYSYCNNIDYHKKKAIEDVEDYLETGRYKRYDSTWLYVLFHLFNSLRSKSIITQIPRIDLSSTSIKDLEWLKYNNPTIEDANIIINQINRYVHHIGKTGVDAKAKFQIGEPMKVAFAIAISICEFRQREINSMDNKLIDLNKSLDSKSSMYKFFFSEFESDLVFASRKMNRTLETFISIITDYYTNGGSGIKAAQIARGHLNKETTKIYIKLSESEVEKLTLQLFERKSFGFVTKIFSELLFEGSKINEDKNIKVINQFFGGVDKIEVTSGVINKISSEQEKVREYLKSFSLEEINNLWLSSIVGVLPTHQEYYQCIYKECIHVDEYGKKAKMCENCESAICNVYALTTLMNLYIDTLDYLVNNFYEESEGEKRRLANHFYLLHKRVSEARQMFGKEVVNGFIDGGSLKVESITSNLKEKDLRKYKTIEY